MLKKISPLPLKTKVQSLLTLLALLTGSVLTWSASAALSSSAYAAEAADAFIQRVSSDTFDTIRNDKSLKAGDTKKVMQWVDSKLMPHVDFRRMTASTVGPAWRKATPEQQKRLQEEFKLLLIQTYAGALSQLNDQTITVKPLRAAPEDKEVLVRTEIKGKGEPVQLDYRLSKSTEGTWKIYDLNVMGVWLVENYRGEFAKEVNANGIDGLIQSLANRNKANNDKKA